MKNTSVQVHSAIKENLSAILDISNEHLTSHPAEGFLIKRYSIEELETSIDNISEHLLVAETQEQEIVGFLKLQRSEERSVLENLKWHDDELKREFETEFKSGSENISYIEQLAVRKDYLRRGIGSILYKAVFNKHPNMLFYCFIVMKPFKNQASLDFHLKLGFKEAAWFRSAEFCGLKDYESTMLIRNPIKG